MSTNTIDTANQLLADNAKLKAEVARLNERVWALAAEGANMRNAIDQTIGWQQSVDAENTESVRALVELETPATDAILREVGARAVDLHAKDQREQIGKPHKNDAASAFAAREAVRFAARIRAGEVQP